MSNENENENENRLRNANDAKILLFLSLYIQRQLIELRILQEQARTMPVNGGQAKTVIDTFIIDVTHCLDTLDERQTVIMEFLEQVPEVVDQNA